MATIDVNDNSIVRLSVEKWHRMALEGTSLPMVTVLNGKSMEPLIRYRKDIVTIVPVNRKLIPGDIVLFERPDGLFVVHRLYRLLDDGNKIQTWGDNCYNPDPICPITSVWGIVVSIEKNGKQRLLDTDYQRRKGLRWLESNYRRYIWFAYSRVCQKLKKNDIQQQSVDRYSLYINREADK